MVPAGALARSVGAPVGTSGVPGEGVCTACHTTNALNSGSGRIRIQVPGGATTYTPGQSIRLTVLLEDEAARRWGFALTARSASAPGTPAGVLSVVPSDTNAQVQGAAGSVQQATHTSAGTRPGTTGPATWELDWTPPAGGGPVTLFAAGNAANNSNNNQGDQIYTTSLTLQPADVTTGPMRVLPQLAFGGGWYTAMYFYNSGPNAATFPLRTYRANGEAAETRNITVPAGGSAFFEAPNTGNLTQGWAGAEMPDGVHGHGVFRQSVAGRADQEAVVPFSSDRTQRVVLLFDDTAGLRTTIAVANPTANDVSVNVVARGEDGQALGSPVTLTLRARERQAFALSDRAELAALNGRRGSVEFTTPTGAVSVLGLRFGGAAFTSIPAIER
ncbi:MAG TPA: choice-of-anchor V domain-containing protein [Bryobacteraceae bacterium]|nr:choice-of-anchor V domain-containing protein [Bryobacteraceae bacterium]